MGRTQRLVPTILLIALWMALAGYALPSRGLASRLSPASAPNRRAATRAERAQGPVPLQTVPPPTPTPNPFDWRQVALAGHRVRDVVVHPEDGDTVMACTRGDDLGVFVTRDGGTSWHPANNGITDLNLYRLTHGASPWTVYAAAHDRLWVSSDGGQTWGYVVKPASFSQLSGVVAAAGFPARVYLTAWEPCKAMFVSSDAGEAWDERSAPYDLCANHALDSSIAVSHSDSDVVYLARGHDLPQIYRSADAGAHWARLTDIAGGQGVNELAMDPMDHNHLYAATFGAGVYVTRDGGVSWRASSYGLPDMGAGTNVTALCLNPRTARVAYAAVEGGGVYRTETGGLFWERHGSGLPPSATIHALAVSPQRPDRLWAATGDGIWVREFVRNWLPMALKAWVVPPSPTPTPTPTLSPTPEGCFNVIENGGFEVEGVWEVPTTEHSAGYTGVVSHAGTRAMRLGIEPGYTNVNSYSSAYQPFTVPEVASSVTLSYWWWRHTEEPSTRLAVWPGWDAWQAPRRSPLPLQTSLSGDVQMVLLLDAESYVILARLEWTLTNDGGWAEVTHDLTDWRGRDLAIYFDVYNDGLGGRSWMYVDDVSIQACLPLGAKR